MFNSAGCTTSKTTIQGSEAQRIDIPTGTTDKMTVMHAYANNGKVILITFMSSGILSEIACTLKYNGCNANTERELHDQKERGTKLQNSNLVGQMNKI